MPRVQIKLLYFAVLRDIIGKRDAVVTLPEGTTALEVWQRLKDEHGDLNRFDRPPMIAVNQTYARGEEPLRDGDELAFIPPVAGG